MATDVQLESALRRWWQNSQRSAGIFGTIVGASVLASTEEQQLSDVAWSVVVTLVVYWLAERWSEVLGRRLRGSPISAAQVARVFGQGWPMVQASYTPLLVMLIAWAAGASNEVAIDLALGAAVVMLVVLGVAAGRRANLGAWGAVASGGFSGLLGVALILLKAFLH